MFEALLLIAIIAYLAHLGRRVTKLEQRWDEMCAPQQYWAPEPASDEPREVWQAPAAAETVTSIEEPPMLNATAIGAELLERCMPEATILGLELIAVAVRDVMVPGELKRAYASVIAAR